MNTIKKYTIIGLCLCLFLSLIGCQNTEETFSIESKTASQQPVSAQGRPSDEIPVENTNPPPDEEYLYVPSFQKIDNINDSPSSEFQCGDVVYKDQSCYDPETDTFYQEFWAMDLNTRKTEPLQRNLGEQEYIIAVTTLQENTLVLLTIITAGELGDGDDSFHLIYRTKDGQEIRRVDITESLSDNGKRDLRDLFPKYIKTDKEDHIYIMLNGMSAVIVTFNSQGELLFAEETDRSNGIYQNPNGQVFYLGRQQILPGEAHTVLRSIDPSSGRLAETWEGLPKQIDLACFESENTLLISSGNTLYRYDMTAQSCEELLNWINIGIKPNDIYLLASLSDGHILALTNQYDSLRSDNFVETVILTWTPASQVPQKATLTLGTLQADYAISEQIITFNRTSSSCQIQVKEYGNDEAGRMLLQADILSGHGPDILDLNAVNTDAMITKGFLTDLYPLMEQCADTKKEDFFSTVLSIYERNGKLYGIVPGFRIQSLIGKTSVIGERTAWTVSDMQALLQEYPPETMLIRGIDRENALQRLLMLGMEDFIDWNTGNCSFDSAHFQSLLEFCSMLPEERDAFNDDFMEQIAQNKILLNTLDIYQIPDYQLQCAFFAYEPVNCIGYPSSDGRGTLLTPRFSLAILESCPDKEAAWEFISLLLAEPFQIINHGYFPIRESSLLRLFQTDKGTSYSYNSLHFDLPAPSEEDIAAIVHMIENGKGVSDADRMVLQIVEEEAAAYFAGQRSAEDVSHMIQNRVQLYVGENR